MVCFRACFANQFPLQLDRLADPGLRGLESLGDHGLGHAGSALVVVLEGLLRPAGLDHHDRDVRARLFAERPAGDDELERRGIAFLVGGLRKPGPVDRVRHPDGTDRSVERDARQHQGRRRGVDGEHVMRVDLVGAENRPDDVDLVAEPLGERGAQRPVDQTGGENRLVGRPALPAEERAGDLAGGVHPLFDVDGEGEEVRALTHFSSSRRGGEHDRVADPCDDGTIRLAGQLAGLEGQGPVGPGNGSRHGNGISHVTPMCLGAPRWSVPSRRAPERSRSKGIPVLGDWQLTPCGAAGLRSFLNAGFRAARSATGTARRRCLSRSRAGDGGDR